MVGQKNGLDAYASLDEFQGQYTQLKAEVLQRFIIARFYF